MHGLIHTRLVTLTYLVNVIFWKIYRKFPMKNFLKNEKNFMNFCLKFFLNQFENVKRFCEGKTFFGPKIRRFFCFCFFFLYWNRSELDWIKIFLKFFFLQLTDEALREIAANCHDLRVLNLYKCQHVTDGGVQALADGCQYLQYLCLSYCPHITDRALQAIAQGCPMLK